MVYIFMYYACFFLLGHSASGIQQANNLFNLGKYLPMYYFEHFCFLK